MSNQHWDEELPKDLFDGLNVPEDIIDTPEPERIAFDHQEDDWQDQFRRDTTIYGERPSKKQSIAKRAAPVVSEEYTVSDDTGALISLENTVNKPTVDVSLEDVFSESGIQEHDVHEPPPEPDDTELQPVESFFDLPSVDRFDHQPPPAPHKPTQSFDQLAFDSHPKSFDDALGSDEPDDDDFDVSSIDIEGTIDRAQQSTKLRKRIITGLTAAATLVMVVFGAQWLIGLGAQRGLADIPNDIDLSFLAEPAQVDTAETAGEFAASGSSLWGLDPDEARLMSVYRAGILQVHDGTVKLRNINTGDVLQESDIDEAIESTYETFDADGDPAVGYRTDTQVTIISKNSVESWEVEEPNLKLVASGDLGLLVDSASYEAHAIVPGEDELVKAHYDRSLMLSGADQDYLLQPTSNVPQVDLVSFDGEDRQVIDLKPPHEQTSFIRHLAIGHGLSLALWELEDVRFATTHSLEDGRAISTVPIEAAEKWTFGRGADLAVMGRYAIEISTGHFIVEADQPLTGAINTVPFVEESSTRTLIVDGQPLRQSTRLRGVTESVVVIENGDSSISVYPHTGSPDEQTHGGGLA